MRGLGLLQQNENSGVPGEVVNEGMSLKETVARVYTVGSNTLALFESR